MKTKSLGKSDWPSQCQSARHRLRVLEQLQGRGLAEQYIPYGYSASRTRAEKQGETQETAEDGEGRETFSSGRKDLQ